jgi:hypothetical protein
MTDSEKPVVIVVNFPAFDNAMDDDRLNGAPIRLYLNLSRRLDFQELRAEKEEAMACAAKMRASTMRAALRRLCDLGYIERGPKVDRIHSYRLFWSVRRDSQNSIAA